MKIKRFTKIYIIVFVTILLVGLVISALLPVPIDVEVWATTQVDDEDYPSNGRMDVEGSRVAWQSYSLFGPKLTVVDDSGARSVVHGVTAPFQLWDDQVVFIKDGSLRVKTLDGKTERQIADDVSSFIAMPEFIVYQTGAKLHRYDPYGDHSEFLKDDTYLFFVWDGQICSMEEDGSICCLGADGMWTEVLQLHPNAYPFSVQVQGDRVVYEDHNVICYVDMQTGATKEVRLIDESYSNHRIQFACDEANTFVSFQGTNTNGSVITDIDHESNGLWVIDAETLMLRKLSDDVFQELYLFNGTRLFGVKDRVLYEIDTRTGASAKVAGFDLQHEIGSFLYSWD